MDPFIGEIIMFGGNFAPRSWALCDGQLMPISSNEALFSILGTTFGGDGRTTFALPDLRGRVPIHPGTGPGLSTYRLGQKGGVETVTLTTNQIPSHSHTLMAEAANADQNDPTGRMLGIGTFYVGANARNDKAMSSNAITSNGGSQSHTNIQPYQCVNYIICLFGSFPSRN